MASWRDLVRELREDTPTRESALEEYQRAMRAAHEFTVDRDLVTVPDGELRRHADAGVSARTHSFRGLSGPGRVRRRLTRHVLRHPAATGRAVALALPERAAGTALHEGVPGHHLQIVTASRLPRVVRRVLASPAAQEGWALYCENLMAEQGFISDPAVRFFQVHHLLWRALRVILDVSLHTKGLSVDKAAALLRDELALEEGAARAEAVRYCAFPTYQLCYALGRRDILRLRDDARQARGAAFSLRAFHDELLTYGALPTPLARWGMGLAGT